MLFLFRIDYGVDIIIVLCTHVNCVRGGFYHFLHITPIILNFYIIIFVDNKF